MIKRMTPKLLITKKSPKPKPQPGRNARKERREHPEKTRTVKKPAVVEVAVRRRSLAPNRCGRPSPRTIPKPSPKKPKKSSRKLKIKKIPRITKLKLSLNKCLTSKNLHKRRSPSQSQSLSLNLKCQLSIPR